MKANYLIASMAAAALLLASCQREELGGSSLSGEEVSVSISAVMPDGGSAVVKSDTEPGDGSLVFGEQVHHADILSAGRGERLCRPHTVWRPRDCRSQRHEGFISGPASGERS